MKFEDGIKELIKKNAELQELFIFQQISPMFNWDEKTSTCTMIESLRIRLAEIKDYKHIVEEAIEKTTLLKVNSYNNADFEGFVDKDLLLKELGLIE